MSLPLPDVGTLLVGAVLALLAAGVLAPFEALGWWAGWFGDTDDDEPPPTSPDAPPARGFLVFLSGIHTVGGESFAKRERAFLDHLRRELPELRVLEVFPYSVTNRALTGQRLFARFWRWALRRKLGRRTLDGIAGMVINLRNAWQVAVSADARYGPMYDEGSAELIERALLAAGYRRGSGAPVLLVGYSGGGQIALGASSPLAERLGRRIHVVSLGGVMASPRTTDGLERLVHVRGSNDLVARIGAAFFPGRWPWARWSAWNRAKEDGLVRVVDLGPMDHTGRDGYLDDDTRLPDGRSYLDATVATIAEVTRAALAGPGRPTRERTAG